MASITLYLNVTLNPLPQRRTYVKPPTDPAHEFGYLPPLQGQLLMFEPLQPLPLAISQRDLAVAPELVLVDHEALKPDGAARVDLVGADADLGAEAVAHAVGHAGGRVPVDAGGVDAGHEALGEVLLRRQDRVRVLRPVRVDVGHGLVEIAHRFDRQRRPQELRVVVHVPRVLDPGGVVGRRELARERGFARRVAPEHDALCCQRLGDGGEQRLERRVLHQEGLHAVAGRLVAGLGVDYDVYGYLRVCGLLEEDGA